MMANMFCAVTLLIASIFIINTSVALDIPEEELCVNFGMSCNIVCQLKGHKSGCCGSSGKCAGKCYCEGTGLEHLCKKCEDSPTRPHHNSFNFKNYKDHPCKRSCDTSDTPMLCEYDFTVEWYSTLSKACYNCPFNQSDCERPDCIAANGVKRTVLAVNRMIPGPAIEVCQNDIISVYVHNNMRMSESTSIHWHGITQKGTPYMDGVGMVTQCPIESHTLFQYKFKAQDAGTHLWHSHSAVQRGDGLFGPIIVRQKSSDEAHFNKYDFDLSEHVISLIDWIDESIISKYMRHQHDVRDDKPQAILINGKGVRQAFKNNDERTSVHTKRASFTVKQGYRYRFRIINAGVLFCPLQISVDQHQLEILSLDGKPVESEVVDAIFLQSAERVDFVINANKTIGNYWIKVKGIADCDVNEVFELGILNYDGIEVKEPFSSDLINYNNIEVSGKHFAGEPGANLDVINVPLDKLRGIVNNETEVFYERIKGTPDKKFYFGLEFKHVNNPEFNNEMFYSVKTVSLDKQFYTPQVNEITLQMPSAPPLYQWNDIPKDSICTYNNRSTTCPFNSTTELCSCVYVIEANLNDLVEFVIVDETLTQFEADIEQLHPMHLHGYSFAILSMSPVFNQQPVTVDVVKKLDSEGKLRRNFDRPPLKDTAIVPEGGYTIIRFVADNPGVWFFHCHLDFHSEVGMGFLFKVGGEKDLPKIPDGWRKCGSYFDKS